MSSGGVFVTAMAMVAVSVGSLLVWTAKKYIAKRIEAQFEQSFKRTQQESQQQHDRDIEGIRAEYALQLEHQKSESAKELMATKEELSRVIRKSNRTARLNERAYWGFHRYFELIREVALYQGLVSAPASASNAELHAELLAMVSNAQWQKIRQLANDIDTSTERLFFRLPAQLGLRIAEFKLSVTKVVWGRSLDADTWAECSEEMVQISAALATLAKEEEEPGVLAEGSREEQRGDAGPRIAGPPHS